MEAKSFLDTKSVSLPFSALPTLLSRFGTPRFELLAHRYVKRMQAYTNKNCATIGAFLSTILQLDKLFHYPSPR
jgi:hypothetical protein